MLNDFLLTRTICCIGHYSEGLLFERSAIEVSVRVWFRVRIAYVRNSGPLE